MTMKKKYIILIICGILILALILGGVLILNRHTSNSQPVRIYLPEGTSREALVDTLQTYGILDKGTDTRIFNFQFSILGGTVHPGSYVVESHIKTLKLIRQLRNGQQSPIRLTIGKYRLPQQLNEYLNSKLMHNDFNVPLDSFHLIRPNTYEVYWTITPQQFMQRMNEEYKRFWQNREPFTDGTEKDAIILASIVEEETNNNEEKPLIASVYLNRIKRGMPLQADPTVKYAVGDFTLRRILNRHLAVESPFNTYLHTGLPPAPICLPSTASVDAVLKAPESNYLYFCASDKMDGTHRFASTLAEHNRNAAAFHRALNANGIK